MKGFLLGFGIGIRGPECFYDGATQPPSQPRSRSKDAAYYVARVKTLDDLTVYLRNMIYYAR